MLPALRIVRLFPDLLGTYGDDGNALVLERRAAWRSLPATLIDVTARDAVPDDGHVYLIGGGEDGPQSRAAQILADSGALHRAVERGAAVLAVCAGFQILGNAFLGPDGNSTDGLGLLLRAEFLAIALVLVYVGAVMVLFLFVVMMLDVNFEEMRRHFRSYLPVGAAVGGLVLLEMVLVILSGTKSAGSAAAPAAGSNTKALGRLLYVDYVYPRRRHPQR